MSKFTELKYKEYSKKEECLTHSFRHDETLYYERQIPPFGRNDGRSLKGVLEVKAAAPPPPSPPPLPPAGNSHSDRREESHCQMVIIAIAGENIQQLRYQARTIM